MSATGISILPVTGLPEIREGDDLAAVISSAFPLRDGDVVVVSQKVVSKAEGAVVRIPDNEAIADVRHRLAREQAHGVVVDSDDALIVRTKHGMVCANAGIDASNAEPGSLILLPDDPDASAGRLRKGLTRRTRGRIAVVITDTFGRSWRIGQTDVALGVSGIACIRDERSVVDRSGRPLEVTRIAVVDEIAAAADLVRRKAEGVPVVVIRGLDWDPDEEATATQLVREPAGDLFPRGRGELARALRSPTALLPPDDEGLRRAVAEARSVAGDAVGYDIDKSDDAWSIRPRSGAARVPDRDAEGSRGEATTLGAAAGLMLAMLVDAGYAATLSLGPDPVVRVERPERGH